MKIEKALRMVAKERVVRQEMKELISNPYTPEDVVVAAAIILDHYSVEED